MALNGGYGLNYDMYRGMSPVQVATYNGGKVPEGFDWSRYQGVQDPSSGWGTGSNIQAGIDAANSYASRTGDNYSEWNRGGLITLGSQPASASAPAPSPGSATQPPTTITGQMMKQPAASYQQNQPSPVKPSPGMVAVAPNQPSPVTLPTTWGSLAKPGMAPSSPPKDGSSPPAAPDFLGAAGQQGAENAAAAGRQARLNNPNFYGVGGSQTVSFGPDGTPTVTQNLSPEQQALYNSDMANRMGASRMASGLLGMGGFGGAFDLSGAPAMPGSYESTRTSVIDALMKRANEDFGRREDQTNSDLIARGIRPGTRAYAEEMARLDRAKNDARSQAEITAGDAVEQAMRSDLARRTQGVNEATLSRTLPFNEYQALSREGGFEMPNLPGYAQNNQVAPAPIFGATTAASNYDVDVWNALMQQQASERAGQTQIGSTILNSNLFNRFVDWALGRGRQ